MNIYEISDQFKAKLVAGDVAATKEIMTQYVKSFNDIQRQIAAVIDQAKLANRQLSKSEVARLSRYAELERDLDKALHMAARNANDIIFNRQVQAIHTAYTASSNLILATKHIAERANISAINAQVGLASNGSPIIDLLNQYGQNAASGILQILANGIAQGQAIPTMVKLIKAKYGGAGFNAVSLCRTETLRTYREGLRANYQANSAIIQRWQWDCNLSARTCAACLALDGKQFDLNTAMPAHVQCRCTMIPVVTGFTMPDKQTGKDWFDEQSESTKLDILGNKGYQQYKDGYDLTDFAHTIRSNQWGNQIVQKNPE